MASRDLSDLQPGFEDRVRELLSEAEAQGLELLVYCTYRSPADQARLYRQSRNTLQISGMADRLKDQFQRPDLAQTLLDVGPQYGPRVTMAAPGMSIHQYGLAIDAVPMRAGKPVWGTTDPADRELWHQYGEIARELSLEWAGDWESFVEYPHVQDPDANWRELIRG